VDQGRYWVLYKRLERGTFAWPAASDTAAVTVRSSELLLVLAGVDVTTRGVGGGTRVASHARWRRRWYERVAS
jgi:hypothetical protein